MNIVVEARQFIAVELRNGLRMPRGEVFPLQAGVSGIGTLVLLVVMARLARKSPDFVRDLKERYFFILALVSSGIVAVTAGLPAWAAGGVPFTISLHTFHKRSLTIRVYKPGHC